LNKDLNEYINAQSHSRHWEIKKTPEKIFFFIHIKIK